MNKKKYKEIFTTHLRERYCMRFLGVKKEDVKDYIRKNHKFLDVLIRKRLNLATNEKSFLNNTNFMLHLYDKYGVDKKIEFWLHDDVVFVKIIEKGVTKVVTCYEFKNSVISKMYNKQKF